jgi:hypothetical protein
MAPSGNKMQSKLKEPVRRSKTAPEKAADADDQGHAPNNNRERLSEILGKMAGQTDRNHTMGDIVDVVSNRSLGALLAFFAAINLIPLPPGTSTVTGIPLVLIAIGMLLSKNRIYMPGWIRNRSFEPDRMKSILLKLGNWAKSGERVLQPRFWPFGKYGGNQLIGAVVFFLGMAVVLPIPLGNAAPAFSAFLLGMAQSENDGLWLYAGLLATAASFTWIFTLVEGAVFAASVFSGWF